MAIWFFVLGVSTTNPSLFLHEAGLVKEGFELVSELETSTYFINQYDNNKKYKYEFPRIAWELEKNIFLFCNPYFSNILYLLKPLIKVSIFIS